MDGRKDFTIDSVNFGDLADYFRELRQNHSMKTIIILVSKPCSFLVSGKGLHCRNKFYSKTVNNDRWFSANWRLLLHSHVLSWAFDGMMGITRCWHHNIVISCILDIWSLLRMAVYSGIALLDWQKPAGHLPFLARAGGKPGIPELIASYLSSCSIMILLLKATL